ncbi:MAG: hypothetical protein R3E39_28295 [Anaerolineae bacterium]
MELFSAPMQVESAENCFFYHAIDLPTSGFQPGQWDLRGRFDEYINKTELRGKRVLDVGTASGFVTFEAEKRGAAEVVSVDVANARSWQLLPFVHNETAIEREKRFAEQERILDAMKRSYWLSHRELNSKAQVYYGHVYDLPDALGQFDVVLVGQILVHLRDNIASLTSIAARCRHTLVITEAIFHERKLLRILRAIGLLEPAPPTALFLGRHTNPDQNYAFWHYSKEFYVELMKILGFEFQSISNNYYLCNTPQPHNEAVTTMVFQRK